jgi:glycosyltransferase involved in cell wall biosynthesis
LVVSARDESLRLAATLDALRAAFPGARLVLGDDGSRDATAQLARDRGAEVIAGGRRGKGETASRACARALQLGGPDAVYVLCDADLGASAGLLVALRDVVAAGEAEIAIGAFERRSGAGFGLAIGFARWAVRRATGKKLSAPISGQRALSAAALAASLPFAHGFGMELAMTIDALRRGDRIVEIPLELEHRQTGRSPAGFLHRARQLLDFALLYAKGH